MTDMNGERPVTQAGLGEQFQLARAIGDERQVLPTTPDASEFDSARSDAEKLGLYGLRDHIMAGRRNFGTPIKPSMKIVE